MAIWIKINIGRCFPVFLTSLEIKHIYWKYWFDFEQLKLLAVVVVVVVWSVFEIKCGVFVAVVAGGFVVLDDGDYVVTIYTIQPSLHFLCYKNICIFLTSQMTMDEIR